MSDRFRAGNTDIKLYHYKEKQSLSLYMNMFKSYELDEDGEQIEYYCGDPALKIWAYTDRLFSDGHGFFIGVGGIDSDDSSWLWEVELESAEEQKRVFRAMADYYYDIRNSLVSPDIFEYFEYVILPELSYLTGGKEIIYRGAV